MSDGRTTVMRETDDLGRVVDIEYLEVGRTVLDPFEPARVSIAEVCRRFIHHFFEQRLSSSDPAAELADAIVADLSARGFLRGEQNG